MQLQIKKIASLTGHSGSVYCLDKGTKENTFFSGSSDRFVTMWNLETLQNEKFAAKFPAIVYAICHIPEKQLLITGTSAGTIHILDLHKGEEIKILKHHTAPIFDIKYSMITDSFYSVAADGNFAVCSLNSLSLIKMRKLCEGKVRSIGFNYQLFEIGVASADCNIRVFDLFYLDEKKQFTAHELSANIIKYSPDGKFMLSGGRDAHLKIWDAKSHTLIKDIPAHNFAIYDIAFSPDGKLFATASRDKTVKIWNADSFEILARINKENYDGHVNSVNKLLWSKYNNYLISTGDDRAIMVWDVKTV
jgi:WD40 repeat protein